jgi:2',3'-cyclic-nucleotide 2'-phosphodiesterase (5'-nucleotidase family)
MNTFFNRMRLVKPLRLALALVLFTAVTLGASRITILHFNDFHAQVMPYKVEKTDSQASAGLARLVTLLKSNRTTNSLTLFAGDMLMGTEYSTVFKGDVEFTVLRGLVDFMTIGNHEFDYGIKVLEGLRDKNSIPMLLANVTYTNGRSFARQKFAMHTIDGVKIGIFGLVAENTPSETNPVNVQSLVFARETTRARSMVQELKRQGAEVIIALTHIGFAQDKALASAVPGIDLIVGAHSHTKLVKGERVGQTLIAQANWGGSHLGRVVLDYDTTARRLRSSEASLIESGPEVAEDVAAKAQIDVYTRQLDGKLNEVIGTTAIHLDGERAHVRSRETNLGNYIADILCQTADAEIALMNGGGIRDSIEKGPIRIRDVRKVLPFNNTLQTIELPGSALLKVLERAARDTAGGGSFLQVSKNVNLVIRDKRLVQALYKGQPIQPERIYKIATIDFLIVGGGGFVEFKEGRNVKLAGGLLSEVLIEAIRKAGTIMPRSESRIDVSD